MIVGKMIAVLEVRQCRFADLADSPAFADLCAEYGAECALDGLPEPQAQTDLYQLIEASAGDNFVVIGAFDDGQPIGALIMALSVLPHYGVKVAITESYFVANKKRRSGAGPLLLSEAERIAAERGALAIFVSAKVGSKLAAVMPLRKEYRNTNLLFMRPL